MPAFVFLINDQATVLGFQVSLGFPNLPKKGLSEMLIIRKNGRGFFLAERPIQCANDELEFILSKVAVSETDIVSCSVLNAAPLHCAGKM